MRLSHAVRVVPVILLAGCDFGATGTGNVGDGPTSTQLLEVTRAFVDDLESESVTLTLTRPGSPIGVDFNGVCPNVSNTEDIDADGILDDATLTYSGAGCEAATWRGGTIGVDGIVQVIDLELDNDGAYELELDDLTWTYTNGDDESLEYTAVRNGRRIRTGTADSIRVISVDSIARTRTVITAIARIAKDLTWAFGADDDGAIEVDGPLPDGRLAVNGTWHWRRSTEDWDLDVATVTRLRYDASCDSTRRFTEGVITLTGRMAGTDGVLTLTFTGCGEAPTRQWTEDQ